MCVEGVVVRDGECVRVGGGVEGKGRKDTCHESSK